MRELKQLTDDEIEVILSRINPQKSKIYDSEEILFERGMPNWQKAACIEKATRNMQKYYDDEYIDTIIRNDLVLLGCAHFKDIIVREASKLAKKPWVEYEDEIRKRYPTPEWDG